MCAQANDDARKNDDKIKRMCGQTKIKLNIDDAQQTQINSTTMRANNDDNIKRRTRANTKVDVDDESKTTNKSSNSDDDMAQK